MPDKQINIVRPDGSIIQGTPNELARLKLLGNYKEETPEENTSRLVEQKKTEDQDTLSSRFGAAISGGFSGLTGGLSDELISIGPGAEDVQEAAKAHPAYRIGGEIVGALGGSLFVPGSPAGLVTKGATAAGEAVGGGIAGAAAFGAVEGAGAGLQTTLAQSTLDNTPLTAQSVLSGIGFGALYGAGIGGGLGAVGKGLGKISERLTDFELPVYVETEKRIKIPAFEEYEPVTTREEITDLIKPFDDTSFSNLRNSVKEFSDIGYQMGKELDDGVAAAETNLKNLKVEHEALAGAANELGNTAFLVGQAKNEVRTMKLAGRAAMKAIDSGDFERAELAMQKYSDAVHAVSTVSGIDVAMPELPATIISSGKEAIATRTASNTLSSFPRTVDSFIDMSPKKAESIFAAMEHTIKTQDEFSPLRIAVENSAKEMIANSGIVTEGSTVEQLRSAWKIARKTSTDKMITTVEQMTQKAPRPVTLGGTRTVDIRHNPIKTSNSNGIARQVLGLSGAAIAKSFGLPSYIGYYGAQALLSTESLSAIKSMVQNKIAKAAEKMSAGIENKVTKIGLSKLAPLYTRLDGSVDNERLSTKDAAKKRITEITEVMPNIKNILYSAVEPMIGQSSDFAAALHNSAIQAFQMLWDAVPKDPGVAFSNLKSLWKPSDLQAVQTASILDVFHYPLNAATEMMGGDIDPTKVEALKNMYPDIYSYMRSEILANIDFSNMDYNTQGKYSNLLDIPIHSGFKPESIAESQRIFMEVPEPPKNNAGKGGSVGNSGGSGTATLAQNLSA